MGAHAQTTKVIIKDGVGTKIQTPKFTSMALALHGSSSGGLMDVKGLVSQALSELQATFFIETQEQSNSQASAPLFNFLRLKVRRVGVK